MGHHHPPTPDSNELQQLRFEDLRKHDALQQPIYGSEHAAYHLPTTQAPSEYCSPSLVQSSSFTALSMRPYDEQNYGSFSRAAQYPTAENVGLGLHVPYGGGSLVQQQLPNGYGEAVAQYDYCEAPLSPRTAARGSGRDPLTPKSPDSEAVKQNKSEKSVSPKTKTSKARPVRSAKGKGAASNKAVATRIKLDKPISELTAHMTDVPVRDIDAYVHRSASVRHKEVERKNGAIPRPMNSFMLYRSAYAERTKRWCVQNNHQVVSSLSGESWPLEPQEIRSKFNEYATIERQNHARAHPNYKFSPSKAQALNKRRKSSSSSDDDDDNEADSWRHRGNNAAHADAEWRPTGGDGPNRRSKGRSTRRRVEQDYSESSFSSPQNYFEDRPWDGQYAPTPYGNGRMMSMSMGCAAEAPQPYMVHPAAYGPMTTMLSPVSDHSRAVTLQHEAYEQHIPAGLPGSYHAEVFPQPQVPPHVASYQEHVEPSMSYYEGHAQPPPELFSPGAMFNERTPSLFSPSAYEYGQAAPAFDWTEY